jgi:hypothetical protein
LVRWTGIPAPSTSDWIGLYSPGAPDNQYLAYTFTGGAKAGDAKIWQPANLRPGWYEVRMFTNGTYTMMDKGDISIC